ncbi:MAG: glutamate--tRNA ligase [Candidatus Doudnabacteria bacterium RIFCSPHIGHO2_02_FULL_48_21]|uniref:Glutamate--tRNA ligase n=1 Tax=Candidatus Doudnabacteria bacterium RIFCSPLOWO2_02_FULL_48_13 TaxID=1817845 RepID=A0A1F5Q886_9BACT|nr:MAG: glutamate--tRNA ligase [Candidatus Doudnabacteria bacterium RIFCSPHIGHO2_12_FULL_47_25]OGE93862.1 MAG: glutamate--tRNA ligase [Candidatus Doudnabacteria bacterium RIFCSPHIGHO2_02_FULL_48_21]OGE98373.1 MAG: glutamate--tRNA ligase [Candidatus Doudnabacteria bacterium RIFCSPLOWO2_02_FULL_48_13]OGF00415.1 MAG: glutamate--tRNA ligase [Candidatus Doudnabacteria bacterium RIFCSPLOWO2_12_FULL_47_12]
MTQVRVRFAPSPTGFLHVGGVRTALFDFLFARKHKGEFLLRIEDTDQTRYVEGAVDQIKQALERYGLVPDNFDAIIFQSQRLARYQEIAGKLMSEGHAYECFCSPERLDKLRKLQTENKQPPKYDRHCLNLSDEEKEKLRAKSKPVIRMKIPAGETVLEDLIYGKISTRNEFLDDQVLLKSDGYPTYHSANVVDDHDTGITHVIRGEEWVPSTPKHLLLYQMLGWTAPQFAHLPLITKPDHKKLSKRDQASDALLYLDFFEVEAIINYIALLGWNPKTEQEIFSLDELVDQFDLAKVNRANAIFDIKKFNWLNKQWIQRKKLTDTTFYGRLKKIVQMKWGIEDEKILQSIAPLVLSRVEDFWALDQLIENEFSFFFAVPEYEKELLRWKKMSDDEIIKSLTSSLEITRNLKPDTSTDEIQKIFFDHIGKNDKGSVLWPLRAALSGLRASPSPFEILNVFLRLPNGAGTITVRISAAIDKLS